MRVPVCWFIFHPPFVRSSSAPPRSCSAASLEHRLELGNALSPKGLHLLSHVGARQPLVLDRQPALALGQPFEEDVDPRRSVLSVIAGHIRGRRGSEPQLHARQPASAQRLVLEGREQPLHRHADRLRSADGPAGGMLSRGTETACPLVTDSDRLSPPVGNSLLGCQPASSLGVRSVRSAPVVEQLKPPLPLSAGRLDDRLVGGRCLKARGRGLGAPAGGYQHPASGRVALAGLLYARAYPALEGFLPRHLSELLYRRTASRLTLSMPHRKGRRRHASRWLEATSTSPKPAA